MRQLGLYLVLVASCANNVSQDRSTGPDGKQKGAKPLALENGEARATGVVTYPGGDRIDWKKIELPDGQRGDLDLKLTWQSPRPGLQVSFDVFDQWNSPIVATKAAASKNSRQRTTTIANAKGTYWVRVFAPKRGDAGAYKLEAAFHAQAVALPPDLTVPDPPKLPAVPTPEGTCDVFDPKNPACGPVCPELGAPPGWKACGDRDKLEKDREAREQAEKDRQEALKNWPKPVTVRILGVAVESDGVRITLGIGNEKNPKLDTTWTGAVVGKDSGKPLAGGTIRILNIGKVQTQAKVNLTVDQLNANPNVKLTPPPPP